MGDETRAIFAWRLTHLYRTSPGRAWGLDGRRRVGSIGGQGPRVEPELPAQEGAWAADQPNTEIPSRLGPRPRRPDWVFLRPRGGSATVAGKVAVACEVTRIALDAMARIVRVSTNGGGRERGRLSPLKPENHSKRS